MPRRRVSNGIRSAAQKAAIAKAIKASADARRGTGKPDTPTRRRVAKQQAGKGTGGAAGKLSLAYKSAGEVSKDHDLSGHNRSDANKAAYRDAAAKAKELKKTHGDDAPTADKIYSLAKKLQLKNPTGKANNEGRPGAARPTPKPQPNKNVPYLVTGVTKEPTAQEKREMSRMTDRQLIAYRDQTKAKIERASKSPRYTPGVAAADKGTLNHVEQLLADRKSGKEVRPGGAPSQPTESTRKAYVDSFSEKTDADLRNSAKIATGWKKEEVDKEIAARKSDPKRSVSSAGLGRNHQKNDNLGTKSGSRVNLGTKDDGGLAERIAKAKKYEGGDDRRSANDGVTGVSKGTSAAQTSTDRAMQSRLTDNKVELRKMARDLGREDIFERDLKATKDWQGKPLTLKDQIEDAIGGIEHFTHESLARDPGPDDRRVAEARLKRLKEIRDTILGKDEAADKRPAKPGSPEDFPTKGVDNGLGKPTAKEQAEVDALTPKPKTAEDLRRERRQKLEAQVPESMRNGYLVTDAGYRKAVAEGLDAEAAYLRATIERYTRDKRSQRTTTHDGKPIAGGFAYQSAINQSKKRLAEIREEKRKALEWVGKSTRPVAPAEAPQETPPGARKRPPPKTPEEELRDLKALRAPKPPPTPAAKKRASEMRRDITSKREEFANEIDKVDFSNITEADKKHYQDVISPLSQEITRLEKEMATLEPDRTRKITDGNTFDEIESIMQDLHPGTSIVEAKPTIDGIKQKLVEEFVSKGVDRWRAQQVVDGRAKGSEDALKSHYRGLDAMMVKYPGVKIKQLDVHAFGKMTNASGSGLVGGMCNCAGEDVWINGGADGMAQPGSYVQDARSARGTSARHHFGGYQKAPFRYNAIHEFGHAVDHWASGLTDTKLTPAQKENLRYENERSFAEALAQAYRDHTGSKYDPNDQDQAFDGEYGDYQNFLLENMSGYSIRNQRDDDPNNLLPDVNMVEAIAEAFADVEMSESPSPTSKAIHAWMIRKLRDKGHHQ